MKITMDEINRSEISRATEINLAHVSRIFSGKASPSFKAAKKIADHLDISLDEFHDLISR